MDNELIDLEAELRRLRPLAPSRALAETIGSKLSVPARRARNYWAWAALPLAAMVAGALLLREQPVAPAKLPAFPAAPAAPDPTGPSARPIAPATTVATYKPISADNLLYAQSDDGLVTLADGTTARRTRSSYVDTITWRDPRTQASLKWSVPRTEERVIPVSFQ